jgi:hypothetical protein
MAMVVAIPIAMLSTAAMIGFSVVHKRLQEDNSVFRPDHVGLCIRACRKFAMSLPDFRTTGQNETAVAGSD